ncbi:MAG: hypothetical protein HYV29_08115 [Ignavibacteriales bacterium]|nr:hypothetical protein [Ignavibacteriales bacterium]
MNLTDRTLVIRATQIVPGTVPGEIQVVPFGIWKAYKGAGGKLVEFEVTKELGLKAVQYHQQFNQRYPQRDLPIDYEHQTLQGGEAPAAGWYKNIFLKSDGIYTKVKEWTKKAEQYLLNKEYRYQSPVLLFNDVDGETGEPIPLWISSIALTNSPFVNGIAPVVAKENAHSTIIYLTDSISQPTEGDTTMLERILTLFGLAKDATYETVEQKFNDMKNSIQTVAAKYKAAMNEIGLKDDASTDDVKAFSAKVKSIFTELGIESTAELPAIKAAIVAAKGNAAQQIDLKDYVKKSDFDMVQLQLKERDFTDLIGRHTQRGAVLPAEIDDLKKDVMENRISCKDLNDRLTKRADYSLVPLKEIEAKNIKPATTIIDAAVLEVSAKAGVSREDIEKYGK